MSFYSSLASQSVKYDINIYLKYEFSKKLKNENKKKDSGINETNKIGICSFGSGLSQPVPGKTVPKRPVNMIHEITNTNRVHRSI